MHVIAQQSLQAVISMAGYG